MAIVGGLDIHRRQITHDYLDVDTGQARHGRIQPATRVELRAWLARLAGQQADFAFEGTTGWRFVAEEVMGAGFRAHLAEPADTRALRGPSGAPRPTRPTPATCATYCCAGRCPSRGSRPPTSPTSAPRYGCVRRSWTSAPAGSSASTPCCTTTACPNAPGCSAGRAAPGWPAWSCPPWPARLWIWPCARSTSWMGKWTSWTPPWPASPPASRAVRRSWAATGSAGPAAVSGWAEVGDVRRFANSRQAVRFTGLDITVAASDTKRARGPLARQGPPVLRWALHEAAMRAARPGSPDHAHYQQVRTRLGGKRAALSVAHKLAREAYHTLRTLGDQALAPVVLRPAA